MFRVKNISRLLFGFFLIGCVSGCNDQPRTPLSETRMLLGTFVQITGYDTTLPEKEIRAAIDSAFSAIGRLEKQVNPFDSGSLISQINMQSLNDTLIELPPGLKPLLQSSWEISEATGGAFDFTIWPVFKLWNFGTDSAAVPPESAINSALVNVSYQQVKISDNQLILKNPGVQFDLSGISKGYAVEMARGILKGRGLRNFIIDAGGNLGIEWQRRDSVNIYIRHPRLSNKFWGKFTLAQTAGIATSGDYQNYFIKDSLRFHHILNPETGYPVRHTVSATIIAPNAVLADGFSTAIFVMGPERGSRLIESHPKLDGLIIFSDADTLATYISPGIINRYEKIPNENRVLSSH